ncbi:MAG: hypothetical protein HOV97_29680 [Nonomuraea sp.]|nr:hypothetical protein [Nonomuraea sp.]
MADLYVDSRALRGFTDQLNRLTSDFGTPVYESGAPSSVDEELRDLAGADKTCGERLNNFLTSLARYTDAAATAAEQLDENLAKVPDSAAGSRRTPRTATGPEQAVAE